MCEVHTFYTQISCIKNKFDTPINVLMDEIRTYEWTNVRQISYLFIIPCFKRVFNTQYQCVKHTNFAWFLLLSREMLSLWCCINGINSQVPFLSNDAYSSSMATCHDETSKNWIVMWKVWVSMNLSSKIPSTQQKNFELMHHHHQESQLSSL